MSTSPAVSSAALARRAQDSVLDRIASGEVNASTTVRTPLSLRPDQHIMHAVAAGSKMARAIVDGWRFHEPVTNMNGAELESLAERRRTVFAGRGNELGELHV